MTAVCNGPEKLEWAVLCVRNIMRKHACIRRRRVCVCVHFICIIIRF